MPFIDRIHIENYRSIKSLNLKLNKMNALIGQNNAGKSNIMRALALVLGDTWPSNKNIDKDDHYGRDINNPISIQIIFNGSLNINNYAGEIYGFKFECSVDDFSFVALDSSGNTLTYNRGKEIKVIREMRDEVPMVIVGVDRQSSQQVRATRWTLYGKILEYLANKIPEENMKQFVNSVTDSFNSNIYNASQGEDIKYFEEQLKESIKDHTGMDLILELSILDSVNAIKNVRPYFKQNDSDGKYDPEEMGAGIQSALSVSIARAYSEIVKKSVILAIDEPELHFHPQACRNFYNYLNALAGGEMQIIYTTHSQYFVDISKYENINIVRKNNSSTTVISGSSLSGLETSREKIATKFNDGVNQALFADLVILVEGPDDEIACKAMLEKEKFYVDKNNVSVVSCGGVRNVSVIAGILTNLKIKTMALIDEDLNNNTTKFERSKLINILGSESVFIQYPNLEGLFEYPQKFKQESALNYFQDYNGNVPEVYSKIVSYVKDCLNNNL